MSAPTVPIACAICGTTRHSHEATDHRYQVPDLETMRTRAANLRTRRAAA